MQQCEKNHGLFLTAIKLAFQFRFKILVHFHRTKAESGEGILGAPGQLEGLGECCKVSSGVRC